MKQKLFRHGVPQARRAAMVLPLVAVSLVTGCSSINDMMQADKIDYKSAEASKRTPTLEVPPDLTKLEGDRRYSVPSQNGVSTLSGYTQTTVTQPKATGTNVLPTTEGIRVQRDGNQRWLSISNGMPPDQLWQTLREFWQENGFLLVQDSPETGIMETDWAENRAKIPQDFIRSTIGKVFDGLYSTSERDKFRTRLEKTQNGNLEVFISHRGAQEELTGLDKSSTVWTPRAADPELEAEFLSRLAQRLGVQKEQAEQMAKSGTIPAPAAAAGANGAASAPQAPAVGSDGYAPARTSGASYLTQINGTQALQLPEPFDRAWRTVGLALDRVNFTVEDRDRAQGLYYVRYVDTRDTVDNRGFFSKLFTRTGGDTARQAKKYRVSVKGSGNGTTVMVLNDAGQPESTDMAKRILTLLDEQLH
ncbi:outer membrane protein assembly factor BamC [Paracidovorax citrulli]